MTATAVVLFLVGLFVIANAINLREVLKGTTKIQWTGLDKKKPGP